MFLLVVALPAIVLITNCSCCTGFQLVSHQQTIATTRLTINQQQQQHRDTNSNGIICGMSNSNREEENRRRCVDETRTCNQQEQQQQQENTGGYHQRRHFFTTVVRNGLLVGVGTVSALASPSSVWALPMASMEEFETILRDSPYSVQIVEFRGTKSETVVVKLVDGTQFGIKDIVESPSDPRSPLKVEASCREANVPTKFVDIETMLANLDVKKRKLYTNERVQKAADKNKARALRMQQDEEERLAEVAAQAQTAAAAAAEAQTAAATTTTAAPELEAVASVETATAARETTTTATLPATSSSNY